ncbi:GIY-YIG nuclease family protein [Ralstonia flaminis]|jgi:hypothetical protein|uniref:ArsR family transcriptional regulator n=1 Tax=Ralstonia flaminis TaxID=3058597 RepID=A0ABN9JS24_9RALS|nr:GIY-YIG nuclease family protein [Ralstonia sp. LMG 18101]CAJ0822478.1 hypothetical protein LMG18101_05028 [Ralstonia sp. LMG 18101]
MTDRRELKRQYLETRSRAGAGWGVYAIRNLITGRALVKGSTDAQSTLNRHHFELKHGTHANALLRKDWADHGESSFVFEVLDLVKHREAPDFDAAHELETLVTLWRQEIPCQGASAYENPEHTA